MSQSDAYLGFSYFSGIGPLRFKLLKEYFGDAQKAWSAPEEELVSIGLGKVTSQRFVQFRESFDGQKQIEELARKEISVITQNDTRYPRQLSEIPDPPILLYIKGSLPSVWDRAIGVVGTRKPTTYGRQITEQITRDLAVAGFTIVSGLARGVDGIAHRTALQNQVTTIAVLGCGVDIVYPPEHKDLYSEIISSGGAVISEVPPGHTVTRGLFPARNRIISGLSRAVIVTEGAEDSGSLITAKLALDQGRDVFAVPGPITSYLSAGPSKLLKDGAKVFTEIDDVLQELGIKAHKKVSNGVTSKDICEKQIIDLLVRGTVHFDELVRESGFSVSQVSVIVTTLELSGIIRNLGEGKYALIS